MKVTGRIVDCGIIEREVLELLHSNKATEKEQQDEERLIGETHVIESADLMQFYFIWPIPLVFDELTVD